MGGKWGCMGVCKVGVECMCKRLGKRVNTYLCRERYLTHTETKKTLQLQFNYSEHQTLCSAHKIKQYFAVFSFVKNIVQLCKL